MNSINFMLALFVVLLGYVAGYFLAIIAPEELKPGKKYLIIFRNFMQALLVVSVVMLAYPKYIFGILLWIVLYFLFNKIDVDYMQATIGLFIIVLLGFFTDKSFFMIVSSFAFILAAVLSSLNVHAIGVKEKLFYKNKNLQILLKKRIFIFKRNITIPVIVFIITAIMFFVLFVLS